MRGDRDDVLNFKPADINPPVANSLDGTIRRDCLARIDGKIWYPGEIDEVKDGDGRLCYIIDRKELARVLGIEP